MIEDYNEGSPRNVPVEEIKQGDCKGTMKGLIEFLHRKEELQTKYDLVLIIVKRSQIECSMNIW